MIPYKDDRLFSSKDFDEAYSFAETKAKFQCVPLLNKDFELSETGVLKIQNSPFDISEGGIKNLCSTLKIPDPFANRIPTDLFITNVNRLLREKPQDRINAYFNDKEVLIDANNSIDWQAIDTINLLDFIKNKKINAEVRVFFENHFAKIELVPSNRPEQIEHKGEIHKIGYGILHYPTASSISQALMLIWTVACTNGALISREHWREKLNLKAKNKAEIVLEKFFTKIAESKFLDQSFLQNRLNALKNNNFLFEPFQKLVKSVERLVGEDDARLALGPSNIDSIKLVAEPEPDFELGFKEYNVYYSLTDYASNVTKSAVISRKLQSKAGDLFIGSEN